jgi:hypothetical protein
MLTRSERREHDGSHPSWGFQVIPVQNAVAVAYAATSFLGAKISSICTLEFAISRTRFFGRVIFF